MSATKFQAAALVICRNQRAWLQNRYSKYSETSSAVSQVFGDCLPGLFSKIFPWFYSLLQNTVWGQMVRRTNLTAGSLSLMYTSTTALPPLRQQKPAPGKCLDRCGRNEDTTGMAFFQTPAGNLILVFFVVVAMTFCWRLVVMQGEVSVLW